MRPMQHIDSIRIMQVEGLNGATGGGGHGAANGAASGNLAEQAVSAALKYRAFAPVLDKLLQDVGLSGSGLDGLLASAQHAATGTSASPPAALSAPASPQLASGSPSGVAEAHFDPRQLGQPLVNMTVNNEHLKGS